MHSGKVCPGPTHRVRPLQRLVRVVAPNREKFLIIRLSFGLCYQYYIKVASNPFHVASISFYVASISFHVTGIPFPPLSWLLLTAVVTEAAAFNGVLMSWCSHLTRQCGLSRFLIKNLELKWFLIALSGLLRGTVSSVASGLCCADRPGSSFAISHQALPCFACKSVSIVSSSCVQGPLQIEGLRWLNHLPRHC